jgi:hypothetical protein
MAINIANMRATAQRLISENGRAMTLVRLDQGNPTDPTKPWRESTGASEVIFSIIGVFTEFEKEDFDGTLVRRGDKRVLAAASAVEVAAGFSDNAVEDYDMVLDGTVRWKIVDVRVIQPGVDKVLYDIHVRQ